jgi:O-antigen ligase
LPFINALQLAAGLFAIATIASSPDAKAIFRRSAPVLAICGLAALSALWSPDPVLTLRKSMALVFIAGLGLATVARLGPQEAVRCLLATMTIVCLMSIALAIFSPTLAVHQETDAFQSVHAGLWRGVLAHKVSLGIFAGLLIGMAVCAHRSYASMPLRLLAILAGAVCLVGSGSATGIVTAAIYIGVHTAGRVIVSKAEDRRRGLTLMLVGGLLVFGYILFSGLLDKFAVLLGRSPTLTGRSDYWRHIIDFIHSAAPTLGFSYAAGYKAIAPILDARAGSMLTEAHNGYLETLVAFGYLGTPFIAAMLAITFWRSVQLLRSASADIAPIAVFPITIIATNLLTSYAESIVLMPGGIWTVAFMLAVGVLSSLETKQVSQDSSVGSDALAEAAEAYPQGSRS